jgi:hypothetical protein
MRASTIAATVVVLVMLGASFGVLAGNASAAQGTRDSFGYRYTDSKAPAPNVTFNWVDISSTGTASGVTGDDSYGGSYPVGFNFTFYGNTYTTFYISTNGFIRFGGGSSDLSNDNIPSTNTPNNIIAAYWDDLYIPSNTIYYQTTGVEPFRSLVVEYYQVRVLGSSNLMTFEIILNETGDVWLQYLTMNGMTGSSGTAGMENSAGTIGVRYSYNTASLQDNLAVKISFGEVVIDPSQTSAGKPGATMFYNLTVTNRRNVSDSFAITLNSAQGWTVGLYDSAMNPLTDTDGDTIPDTGTIGTFVSASITVTVTIPGSPSVGQDITTVNATSFTVSSVNDSCTLTTDVIAAWFSPPHSDEGWDRDNNGEYEYLYVNCSVYAFTAGWYNVQGYLHTSSEIQIASASNYTYLSAGAHTVSLKYYGWDIRTDGYDGPYHAELSLRDSSWVLLDEDIHYTAGYLDTDFMRIPGQFSTPFSDCGVDTDSDGLYDYLQFNLTMLINYDGRFRIRTYLYDSSWTYVLTQTNDTLLSAGTDTTTMLFSAWDVSKNGVEGVFHTWNYLDFWVDGTWYNADADSYATGTYLLSSLERPAVLFTPPHDDHVDDTDGDFYYDFLTIDASVNVSVEGDYSFIGTLTDWWGDTIDIVTNTTHLAVGDWIVELVYPGYPIRYNGENGPYDVELVAKSGSTELDTDTHSTASYWDTDFETAPGWFELPHDATGLDDNSNGLYDHLVVNVTVNVTLAASYEIHAHLRDSWWNIVEEQTNTTHLIVGPNTVELRFTGWLIRDNGLNGPFTILLDLRDSGARLMDTDSFSTPAFSYTLFENVPAVLGSPHTSEAIDDDSDGLYERLVVYVTVEVDSAGTFYVSGVLYDSGWDWVSSNGTWATLATGTMTVPLSFPGFLIYTHGYDSYFNVYIELADANEYYLDYDYATTATFNFDAFDGSVPSIASGWANIAPTIDGVFSTNEWVDATAVDLQSFDETNPVAGTILFMNDGTNLYIAYDIYGDTHEDDGDSCSIGFDTGNDDVLTDDAEDQFAMTGWSWDAQMHYTYYASGMYWATDCDPFDTFLPDHASLAGAMGFGTSTGHAVDHRSYELSIPLSLLGTSPGQTVGFLGRSYSYEGVYDAYTGDESSWPVLFSGQPAVTQYAHLSLAAGSTTPAPTTTATVSGTAGSSGWHLSSTSVTLSATGGRGGVDYTEYRLDGGSWTTYTAAIAITADGVHTLEFRSVDNAAQVEAIQTLTVSIDTGAPSSTSVVTGSIVWLNGTDNGSGVGSVMYRIDNGTWMVCTGYLTVIGVGTHIVEFYAVDVAGNQQAMQSISVVVKDNGGSTSSFPIIWLGLIGAIVAAVLVILLLVMKRRKGPAPAPYAPPPAGMMYPEQMPQPPPQYPQQ